MNQLTYDLNKQHIDFSSGEFAEIKAIVGLGNPGPRFANTRHNAGFILLDALATLHGAKWKAENNYLCTQISACNRTIHLIKPQTFMNNSGEVWPHLKKKGIEKATQILIVHDEMEKATGTLAMRLGGSARGHNGLRSFIQYCGENFWRLRVGISRPEKKEDVAVYVLERLSAPETAAIEKACGVFNQTLE